MKKILTNKSLWVLILCTVLFSKVEAFNGTKTIGASGADYTTITAALTAANAGVLDGAVILSLQSDYTSAGETFPLNLGAISGISATNTITIRPASTGLSITSNNTTATIDINAGNYFIIDGRVNGTGSTKDLIIANTSTATGGTAIRFTNDASNNTIKYSKLSSTFGSSTFGVVLFSTTTSTTGNDNNTIDNCDIDGKAGSTASPSSAGTALIGIISIGTTTTSTHFNSNNTISNCNIFNFYNASASTSSGVSLGAGNTDWTINANSIYQTATRTATGATIVKAIDLSNTSGNNFIVTNNYIGGSQSLAGGTAWTLGGSQGNKFYGITISVGHTTPTSIQGNNITNINFTTNTSSLILPGVFAGIFLSAGSANIGTTSGNTIGASTGTGAIVINAIINSRLSVGIGTNASSGTTNISNNIIGSITLNGNTTSISNPFMGIVSQSNGVTITISDNIIGSTSTANSINCINPSTSTGQIIVGVFCESATEATIRNNTVANLNNESVPSSGTNSYLIVGIHVTGKSSITGNVIRNLSIAGDGTGRNESAAIIGMDCSSSSAPLTISQNTVHSIFTTHTTSTLQAIGMNITCPSSGSNTIDRNYVHSIKSATSAVGLIYGINVNSGVGTYKNNIVRLGLDETGASITKAYDIRGINDAAGTNNYYHNTVYIGGSSVISGTTNTYAFVSSVTTNTRLFQNNIFVNSRSNTSGTGIHVAYFVSGTLPSPTGLTSNYNLYYANGTGGILIRSASTNYTLASWRTASSLDANSREANPNFILATGTSSTLNLHVQTPTEAENNGAVIADVTNDFDGETRTTLTPTDIGADELSAPLPIELLAFTGTAKPDFNVLTWTTASEINSNYFEVERLNSEKVFENIAHITAAGNSREINQYQFHDATFTKTNAIEYYRLKMVDRDDHFKYSDVIAVKRNADVKASVSLYPNPSSELVNIIISNADVTRIQVRVLDVVGKIIYENNNLMSNEINSIPVADFPSGIYTLQVIGLTENINQKFIKK